MKIFKMVYYVNILSIKIIWYATCAAHGLPLVDSFNMRYFLLRFYKPGTVFHRWEYT